MPARPFEMIDNDFTFMEEANNETLGIPIFKLIQSGPLKFLTTAVTEYLVFETTIVAKENLHGIYSFKKTQLATKNFLIQPIFENINNVISDLPILIKHSEADFQNATSIKVAVLDLNKNSDFESPLTPFCEQFKTTLKLHHLDTPGVTSVKVQIIDGKGIWSTAQIGPFAYPEIYYLRPNSAPQTWLIVKSGDVKRLLKLLPKTSPFDCSNVFCHSNVSITKEWLESVGIKYVVIKHRPGEYVVVKAGTLYQIASCGIAIMDKCSVYLNRCILESRLSYLCCCVDMHAHFDAGTWCSLKTLRDKEEVELVKAFQGSFRKRLPNKSILRPLNDDVQPKHSNQMTPDVARQYVQMVSSNISSAQLDIIPAVETPESQKISDKKRRHAETSKRSYKKKKDSNSSTSSSHADANPQSKRLKTLKQGIAKKIALRRDKISTYYKDNTNTADIAALESEVAKYEVDKSAIGRLQEMESIINEIGRKDPAAQLAIDRLRVQGYFSFDKFRDFFDNNNTKTKKILMEALNARRSKIDYNFWTSLVNNYASWKTVFGQHPDIHRVPVFVQTIEEAFNKLK